MIPFEVYKFNKDEVLFELFPTKKSKQFKVSDRVRIKTLKKTFADKYKPNWTLKKFIITEVLDTNHITYKIKYLNNA